MGLPWVRLDANIPNHDKILHLLSDPSAKRWQAAASYMFSFAWAGGHGTDGEIPTVALPYVHGTKDTARLLEKYHLWEATPNGWTIRNFVVRQELSIITEAKKTAQKLGGIKGNCIKYHGPDCHCWKNSLGSVG
jgi:hypothetical protein